MQQVMTNLNRLGMIAPAVEEGYGFIKDIGGRNQWWKPLGKTLPMGHRCLMILIMRQFQRQQVAGIEKDSH
jgi:hypothetical protein